MSAPEAPRARPLQPLQIQTFGDSITEQSVGPGWSGQLAAAYGRKADVRVRGYSGYNTRWALTLLREQLQRGLWGQPELVVVFFGANDASVPLDKPTQHVPMDEYASNLREIVRLLREHKYVDARGLQRTPEVLLVAPPPIDEPAWHARLQREIDPSFPLNRTLALSGAYASRCVEVASSLAAPCVNLHELMTARKEWRQLLSDGLHLSESGNRFVFERVLEVIEAKLPALAPPQLLEPWPTWREIDPADPQRAFASLLGK